GLILSCRLPSSCVVRSRSFFFQAEDGIRGRNVTGVQTCALPILPLLVKPMKTPIAPSVMASTPARRLPTVQKKFSCCTSIVVVKIGRASCRERGGGRAGARALTEQTRKQDAGADGRSPT